MYSLILFTPLCELDLPPYKNGGVVKSVRPPIDARPSL